MDKIDLKDKVAVITGGAGLIGSRVALGLAECGASVALVDIDGPEAHQCAENIKAKTGANVIGIECDVGDPDSVANMVSEVADKLGPISILHNNAATKGSDLKAFFAPYEEYDLKTWKEVTQVNLDGMFLVSQAVGNNMLKNNIKGSIIQTSSIYGICAPDQRLYEGSEYLGMKINTPAVYSATKAAVVGLSNYLASYWGHRGIRVNTLVPGGIASGQNETFNQNYADRVPLGRMAESDDMVGIIVFLASDSAKYITGQTIAVDGGFTVW